LSWVRVRSFDDFKNSSINTYCDLDSKMFWERKKSRIKYCQLTLIPSWVVLSRWKIWIKDKRYVYYNNISHVCQKLVTFVLTKYFCSRFNSNNGLKVLKIASSYRHQLVRNLFMHCLSQQYIHCIKLNSISTGSNTENTQPSQFHT
jgi:hypothetical protein